MSYANIPSVQEILQCKDYRELVRLIKMDYGLSGMPVKAWRSVYGEETYYQIYRHIIAIMEEYCGR